MPKIKVKSTSSVVDPAMVSHSLTFHITCDTDNITSSSFLATCNLAASASTAVSPSSPVAGVGGPPFTTPSTAKLVFSTTSRVASGTAYTLTLTNASTTTTWTFDNNTNLGSGTTNADETSNVVVGAQAEKKKRSFWQRILDFFRRMFG